MSGEYGRTNGGTISIVTRSGTNQIHGTVYWFIRNSGVDANDFFSNRRASPRIAASEPARRYCRRPAGDPKSPQRQGQDLLLRGLRGLSRNVRVLDHPDGDPAVQDGATSFGVITAQQNQPRKLQAALKVIF
jgi:hypothetical protein